MWFELLFIVVVVTIAAVVVCSCVGAFWHRSAGVRLTRDLRADDEQSEGSEG